MHLHHPKELEDLNAVGGHCPRCKAEYRPGFDTCYDCGIPLLPGAAPEPEHAADESGAANDAEVHPVAVASLPWEEAWLLAGRLRADGIPARVYPDEYASPITGAQALPVGRELLADIGIGRTTFDVMVPDQFEAAARRVVARYTYP